MLVVSSTRMSVLTYLYAFSGCMLLYTEIPLTFSWCSWHVLALTLRLAPVHLNSSTKLGCRSPMRQPALRSTVGWQGQQLRDSGVHQPGGTAISGWAEGTMAAGMAILPSPCMGKHLQEGSPAQGWGMRKAKGYAEDTVAPHRQKIWIEHINIPRFPAWFSIKINPFCNTARGWLTEKFIVWSIKELNHYYSVNIY